jgi:hypothetical protein
MADSPVPPAARVTMSLTMINSARRVAFRLHGRVLVRGARGGARGSRARVAGIARPANLPPSCVVRRRGGDEADEHPESVVLGGRTGVVG